MALIALVSAKGSPGVTTTALACTVAWGSPVVLAECDPAGGTVMAGYLQGRMDGVRRGLLSVAVGELARTGLAAPGVPPEFFGQLIDLDPPRQERLLLPGLSDPAQAGSLSPVWGRLAALFSQLEASGYDVIADCGRLAGTSGAPWPLLWAADVVLLVVQPTLVSVALAVPTLAAITKQLMEHTADTSALGLLVVGEGPHQPREIAQQLKVPVVAALPADPKTAAVLTHGGQLKVNRPLVRAAIAAQRPVQAVAEAHRRHLPARALRQEG